MNDQCEWIEIRLVHEIIADLQSLPGVWIDWKILESERQLQGLIKVSIWNGQVYRLSIALIREDEADAFDDLFEWT